MTFPFEIMSGDAIEHAALAQFRIVSMAGKRPIRVIEGFALVRYLHSSPFCLKFLSRSRGRYLLTASIPPCYGDETTIQL